MTKRAERSIHEAADALKAGLCRWAMWGDRDLPTFEFCCAPVKPGSSYCPGHHSRAWKPAPPHGAQVRRLPAPTAAPALGPLALVSVA